MVRTLKGKRKKKKKKKKRKKEKREPAHDFDSRRRRGGDCGQAEKGRELAKEDVKERKMKEKEKEES